MISFREYVNEALKIVKKHTTIEPDNAIDGSIGNIGKTKVVRSPHCGDIRDKETTARDEGVYNDFIIKNIKIAITKGLRDRGSDRTLITYRNDDGRYDLLVVAWSNNVITLVTVIKGNKAKSDAYLQKARGRTEMIIIENVNYDIKHIINLN